jgi:phosphoenolpyruvate carboxykinase (ATP)
MVSAALRGDLQGVPFRRDPWFGLSVPTRCPGVPEGVLDPRSTWADAQAYDERAGALAARFTENFKQFEGAVTREVLQAGPGQNGG